MKQAGQGMGLGERDGGVGGCKLRGACEKLCGHKNAKGWSSEERVRALHCPGSLLLSDARNERI